LQSNGRLLVHKSVPRLWCYSPMKTATEGRHAYQRWRRRELTTPSGLRYRPASRQSGEGMRLRLLYYALQRWRGLYSGRTGKTFDAVTAPLRPAVRVCSADVSEQTAMGAFIDRADQALARTRAAIDRSAGIGSRLFAQHARTGPGSRGRAKRRHWTIRRVDSGRWSASGVDSRQRRLRFSRQVAHSASRTFRRPPHLSEIKDVRVRLMRLRITVCIGDVLMTEGGDIDKLGRGTIWRADSDLTHRTTSSASVRKPQVTRASGFTPVSFAKSDIGTILQPVAKRTTTLLRRTRHRCAPSLPSHPHWTNKERSPS